jgi:3-oxoadipate enol-lactonase
MMGHLTPDQAKLLETMIVSNEKLLMLEAAKAMLSFDSRARLGEIRCPTLILAGACDTAVPLHHARMLAQGITGAKLHVVPNAGHEMIFTRGSEFVGAVEVFLRNV